MNRRSLLKSAPLAFIPTFGANTVPQGGELDEIFDLLDHTLNFHKRQKERDFDVSLSWEKSAGIFGDLNEAHRQCFSIYSYWDGVKQDYGCGISAALPLYLSMDEDKYIMTKCANKYDVQTGWMIRHEIDFNLDIGEKIIDLYEENLADKRHGRERKVCFSLIKDRRLAGLTSVSRKDMKDRRWDVIETALKMLSKFNKVSGKEKGIMSLA